MRRKLFSPLFKPPPKAGMLNLKFDCLPSQGQGFSLLLHNLIEPFDKGILTVFALY